MPGSVFAAVRRRRRKFDYATHITDPLLTELGITLTDELGSDLLVELNDVDYIMEETGALLTDELGGDLLTELADIDHVLAEDLTPLMDELGDIFLTEQ